MVYRFAVAPPLANDNRDLYETPEGVLFQILKGKRRHLRQDIGRMSPERFREWQVVLQGLNEAEELLLPWVRQQQSPPAARTIAARLREVAGLLIGRRLGSGAGRRRH